MRSMRNQILFLICLSMVIFIGNIDEAFFNDIVAYDSNNETFLRCTTINSKFQDISSIVFFVIQALLSFILMIVFSSLLIVRIFKSRIQMANNKRLKKDTKFAVSSLSMNLLFAILNFPNSVALYLPSLFSPTSYLLAYYLSYLSYGCNFYVLMLTNSIFRKELNHFLSKIQDNTTSLPFKNDQEKIEMDTYRIEK